MRRCAGGLGHLIWRAGEDFAGNGCGVKIIATTAQSFRFYFLSIPIIELASLFVEMLANFCRNLAIGHLVDGFNANDALTKWLARS